MKKAFVFLLGLLAVLLPVQAQIMDTPTEEIEKTLKAIVDSAGILIPAEDAVLNFLAVLIVYIGGMLRYILGHTDMIVFGPYLGLLCIYGYDLFKVGMEYVYVACSAAERALACIPCISCIPPLCNGCIAFTNFCFEPIFLGLGHMLIDIGNSLLPLKEYLPIPFEV
jgi:hypothetical protein